MIKASSVSRTKATRFDARRGHSERVFAGTISGYQRQETFAYRVRRGAFTPLHRAGEPMEGTDVPARAKRGTGG